MTDAEVIVIGSGFGGSISAARLSAAGARVTLLERGPWRDTEPVRSMGIEERAPLPQGRRMLSHLVRSVRGPWIPGGGVTLNARGFFEAYVGKGLNVACTSNVGGGSHGYAGLNVRPRVEGYWNGHADEISDEMMEPHYQSVLEKMGSRAPRPSDGIPNTIPERFAGSSILENDWDTVDLPRGFLLPRDPGDPKPVTTPDGVTRHEADMRDGGVFGSATGAKTTLDFAVLAGAMRKGLRVVATTEVRTIARESRGSTRRYRVEAWDHARGKIETHYTDHVVLAAGALNTSRLLFQSRAAGGLDGMPRLGSRFGGNGDFLGYWHLDDRERDLTQGIAVHGLLRLKEPSALGADRSWPMIGEVAFPSPDDAPLPRWIERKLRHGTLVAGMGPDAQDGELRFERGRMTIAYDPERSSIFRDIRDAFARISGSTGKRIFHFRRPLTVHPTGGACLGRSADDGVVDANGKIFGHEGLFVADASALPRPVGGPPSMTIAAWAEHVADRFVSSHR